MKNVKCIDVFFSENSFIPSVVAGRQSRLIPECITLQVKEGSEIRNIDIRGAWPVSMSKLCRKRRQAIRDTLPKSIFLKNKEEVSLEALVKWRDEALLRYLYLRANKVKLPSMKGFKRLQKRKGRKARQAAKKIAAS